MKFDTARSLKILLISIPMSFPPLSTRGQGGPSCRWSPAIGFVASHGPIMSNQREVFGQALDQLMNIFGQQHLSVIHVSKLLKKFNCRYRIWHIPAMCKKSNPLYNHSRFGTTSPLSIRQLFVRSGSGWTSCFQRKPRVCGPREKDMETCWKDRMMGPTIKLDVI